MEQFSAQFALQAVDLFAQRGLGDVRKIGKASMKLNDYAPSMEVDSETYEVRADGQLLECEPAAELPLAQRYFLF